MENENGIWQWRVEMKMGNKHVNEPLAFICGLWMDKKKWKVDVNVNGKYEVKWGEWFIMRYGCDGDNSIWKFFKFLDLILHQHISSLCCWSSSYETNWSLKETPFSCSHLSFLLEPAKKLILLLQWNVRLSKGERWSISLVMIFTHKTKNLY